MLQPVGRKRILVGSSEGAADGSWRDFVGSAVARCSQPRGGHEALWAPCWKSSVSSGMEFRASLPCLRQLQLCSSDPWLGFGDSLASGALEKVFPLPPGSTSTANPLWIPADHPCTSRCVTFRTKQPLRAAVAGEIVKSTSFTPRIDRSRDLHKQSRVGNSWCWWLSCLTPGLGNEPPALHGRGK